MKSNNECARKVLLEIEKIKMGENLTVLELHKRINEFSLDDVLTAVTMFNYDYYVNFIDKNAYDKVPAFESNRISSLTEKGYRALDKIRDENVWNLMKEKMPDFDDVSIYSIFDIAGRINMVKHNRLFDLPDDIMS